MRSLPTGNAPTPSIAFPCKRFVLWELWWAVVSVTRTGQRSSPGRSASVCPTRVRRLTTLQSSHGRLEYRLHQRLIRHAYPGRLSFEPFKQIGWDTKRDRDCSGPFGEENVDVFIEFLVRHVVEWISPLAGSTHR